jgi:SAM-dependent methyltransferase
MTVRAHDTLRFVNARYDGQRRGDRGDYARYLAGMDASMQQKVALTAAHLLGVGRIADMGMGSGSGSEALAALYPGLHVTGVDVSEEMVALARERFDLPNLDFELGDISTRVFEDGVLQGILNSSVLHHVTSFGAYDHDAAGRALQAQVDQLEDHGVLIVRDFLDPGSAPVWLEVPTDDGDDGDDPRSCSSAALLRRFATEFRSLHPEPGFELEDLGAPEPGWQRFGLDHRMAVEFILRKDYRRDWEAEVKEEYTYFTQERFEACYAALGLRVLASSPIRNPWIVRNRYVGKFRLREPAGETLELPATNYVIVGERVPAGLGVQMEPGDARPPMDFLTLSHYRHRSGRVMDLVSRPNLTVDAIPWFEDDDELFVLARMSYPRPVLAAAPTPALDGSTPPGWVTEPLTLLMSDDPLGQTIEQALERAGVAVDRIHSMEPGTSLLPSPGGLREEIRSMLVRIEPQYVEVDVPDVSGFSTSGRVGALEARQLLRAAQVGGLPDARLELNVYDLLRRRGRDPGPWIGDTLSLPERERLPTAGGLDLLERPARRSFSRASTQESPGFLALECRRFDELDQAGTVVASKDLEYVVPQPLSALTISTALLRRMEGRVFIGLDDDDLPAAQCIRGNSELWVAPAWRLPHGVRGPSGGVAFVRERLRAEYGVSVEDTAWLGGRYHPSTGATPEVVHPLAADVAAVEPAERTLTWVPLDELVVASRWLADGHLRIAVERSVHLLR